MGTTTTGNRQRSTEAVTLQEFICDVAMILSNQGTVMRDPASPGAMRMWQTWIVSVVNGEEFKKMPGRPTTLDKIRFDYDEYPRSRDVSDALTTISAFLATHLSRTIESRWFIATGRGSMRWRELQERDEDYRGFVNASAQVAERYIGAGRLVDFLPEGLMHRS